MLAYLAAAELLAVHDEGGGLHGQLGGTPGVGRTPRRWPDTRERSRLACPAQHTVGINESGGPPCRGHAWAMLRAPPP
jgi:hypothetical protein